MARINLVSDEEVAANPDREISKWGYPLGNLYAHTPELLKALGPFYLPLVMGGPDGRLSRELRELLRIKEAEFTGCVLCHTSRQVLRDGTQIVDEDRASKLQNFEHEDFTDAEKVALRFCERIAADPGDVDDELFEQLREHYNEPQIVEMALAITMMLGMGRLNVVFGVQHPRDCAVPSE